ncbi:hypothetical protein EV188_11023 [Actinomycetospora succinea]|uniref:Uncharacterized protein n=1 Tax=Actinomycetospora succinea TaxID=663603 RepID=A0A4V6PWS8_9PSEU|nr:hypothetical protein [Actinomycetospora succinea]TDQ50027.1 hypothetical protein EV188_11023 [Actinomycetospora succinea]
MTTESPYDQRRPVAGAPGPRVRGGLGTPGPRPPYAAAHPAYVVAAPHDPYGGDGAVVMSVAGGGVRRLSSRVSNVVIGAIVFATCVVPLVIAAIVYLSMPDVDGMLDRVQTPGITVEGP